MDKCGSGWSQEAAEDPDLVLLENHVCEALHQLNLKRRALDEAHRDLNATNLSRYELEHSLDRERQQSEETRLQLDLAAAAARRWEDVGVGGREAASRQRTQLEVALREKEAFKEQARGLQTELMKLRSKTEEDEGQLRVQASYYESHVRALAKVRSLQENATRQLQKLEGDHCRLEAMAVEALRRGTESSVSSRHRSSIEEEARRQRAMLEERLAHMAAEMDRAKVSPAATSEQTGVTRDEELAQLRELLRETQSRLTAETEATATLTAAHDRALGQQTQFQTLLLAAQDKMAAEQTRADGLAAENDLLRAETRQLAENLRLTQQILQTERESSKRAECVERGVQCVVDNADIADMSLRPSTLLVGEPAPPANM